jgi:hypothetical protein
MSARISSRRSPASERQRNAVVKSLVIAEAEQLDDILRHRGPATVSLRLPANIDQDAWERTFNLEKNACGCEYASLFILLSLIVIGAVAYLLWPMIQDHKIASILVGLMVCVTSIVCGKSFGQWLARRRLSSAVHALKSELGISRQLHEKSS